MVTDWAAVPMRLRQQRVEEFHLARQWAAHEALLAEHIRYWPFSSGWAGRILDLIAEFRQEGFDVGDPKLTVRDMFPKSYLSGETLAEQHPKGLPVKITGNPVQVEVFNRQENKKMLRWVLPVQAFSAPGKPLRVRGVQVGKTGAMEIVLGVELAESIEKATGEADVFGWVSKFVVLEPKKARGKTSISARAISRQWLGTAGDAPAPKPTEDVRDSANDDHEQQAAALALPEDEEMSMALHEAEAGEGDESDTDAE